MKFIVCLLVILNSIYICNAQEFETNFLGEDYLLYKGALAKIQNDAKHFRYTFYKNLESCQLKKVSDIIYPKQNNEFNTDTDSLLNRVFRIQSIFDKNGNVVSHSSYVDEPIFMLEDIVSNEKLYIDYELHSRLSFPFNVSKISANEIVICDDINSTRMVDDFTDEIEFNYYSIDKTKAPISLYKFIDKKQVRYLLSLKVYIDALSTGGNNAIILFKDGSKWSKSIKINISADSEGYVYTAMIPLTENDLAILSTKDIKMYRVHIFDEEVSPYQASVIKNSIICLKKAK